METNDTKSQPTATTEKKQAESGLQLEVKRLRTTIRTSVRGGTHTRRAL